MIKIFFSTHVKTVFDTRSQNKSSFVRGKSAGIEKNSRPSVCLANFGQFFAVIPPLSLLRHSSLHLLSLAGCNLKWVTGGVT
ncbi:unnamed protein product, partial [Vitis vinifera]